MGVKFGMEEGTEKFTNEGQIWCAIAKFHPIGATVRVQDHQTEIFTEIWYKRPAGAYPLRDFHKICKICTPFQDALAIKISLDLLKDTLRSYGGF